MTPNQATVHVFVCFVEVQLENFCSLPFVIIYANQVYSTLYVHLQLTLCIYTQGANHVD